MVDVGTRAAKSIDQVKRVLWVEGHQPARSDLDNWGGVEVVSEIVNETALPQINQNSTYFDIEDENFG